MDLWARYGDRDNPEMLSPEQRLRRAERDIFRLERQVRAMANGQADVQAQIDALRDNVAAVVERQQAAVDRLIAAHDADNEAAFAREASQLRELNSALSNFGTPVQPATTRQDVNVPTSGGSGIGPTSASLPNTAGPSREDLSQQSKEPAAEDPAPADAQSRGPNGEPL